MTHAVLDASALLAFLHKEPGADRVAEVIHGARVSAVNYAEVVSHFIHLGADPAAIDAMLAQLPIKVIPADAEMARVAGQLRAPTAAAGLSLCDRFCLALAMHSDGAAFTADHAWEKVSQTIGAAVVLIR